MRPSDFLRRQFAYLVAFVLLFEVMVVSTAYAALHFQTPADSTFINTFDPTQPGALGFAIASAVSVGLVQLAKLWTKFRDASDITKMLVPLITGVGITLLAKVTGLQLAGDLSTWTGVAFNSLALWLTAMGLHAAGKKAAAQLVG